MNQLKLKKGTAGTYLALLTAVVILMFMLRQCSSSRSAGGDAEATAGGDTLNVAIDYSPMSMYMIDDTVGGFNHDLLRALAADNNLKIKFYPVTSLERAISMLDSGICDILVADLPSVSDYKRFLFTEPTFLDRSVLVQRRDSAGNKPVAGVLQLAGKRVRIVAGAPVKSRIYNLGREIGDTIFVDEDSVYSAEQLVMLVATGDIPLAVVNEGVAGYVSSSTPAIDISTNISFSQFQSWMISPDRAELKDSINSMLSRFKETEAYSTLLERYHLMRPPAVQTDTVVNNPTIK